MERNKLIEMYEKYKLEKMLISKMSREIELLINRP